MAKKVKEQKEPQPKRGRLFIPVSYLAETAHQLYKLRPDEPIILNRLKELCAEFVDIGYQRRVSDDRYFKNLREQRRKKSWDAIYTNITDEIHGGTVPQTELVNQNNS